MRIPREAVLVTRLLLEFAEREGLDAAVIRKEAGIPEDWLVNSWGQIPFSQHLKAVRAVARRWSGYAVSLHLGGFFTRKDYDLIGVLIMSAETVAACYDTCTQVFDHLINYTRFTREAAGEFTFLRLAWEFPELEGRPEASERLLCAVATAIRESTPQPLRPLEVRFHHPREFPESLYTRMFQSTVRFGQPHDEIVYLTRDTLLPSRFADPDLHRILRHEFAIQTGGMKDEPERVRDVLAYLRDSLGPEVKLSLEDCAARLGLKSRTLRHLLKQEGVSFKRLLEQTRRTQAEIRLLAPDARISDVAYTLGFDSPRSFNKAFHRWHGMTPGQYRKHRLPGV